MQRSYLQPFNRFLEGCGYTAKGGQIIDAALVPVPIQCNTRQENNHKQGEIPPEWADKPHKQSHKDTDARWTKKNGNSHFGYKNHINIDAEYRFVRQHQVSDAPSMTPSYFVTSWMQTMTPTRFGLTVPIVATP